MTASSSPQITTTTIHRCLLALAIVLLVRQFLNHTTTPPTNAKALVGSNSQNYPIPGDYSDPNHPHCLRHIELHEGRSTLLTLSGTDGNPGCPPDGSGDAWELSGTLDVDSNSLVVDFSPKGGPPHLSGRRIPEGIRWEDGNLWAARP